MRPLDLIAALKADHRDMRSLCDRLKKTSEQATASRKSLFARLEKLVKSHAHAEERCAYTTLGVYSSTRPKVLEGYEEHHVCDVLMREMSKLSVTDERWTAKMEVLSESLSHHLGEEEEDLFPKLRERLSPEELRILGLSFRAYKRADGVDRSARKAKVVASAPAAVRRVVGRIQSTQPTRLPAGKKVSTHA